MRRSVHVILANNREQTVMTHSLRTHVQPFKPPIANYVLFDSVPRPRTNLSSNWVRPRSFTKILSDYSVEVNHMLSGTTIVRHGSRICLYDDFLISSVATMKKIAQRTNRMRLADGNAKENLFPNVKLQVLISWKGLRDFGPTWEPFEVIHDGVSSATRSFFLSKRSMGNIKKGRAIIRILLALRRRAVLKPYTARCPLLAQGFIVLS